MTTESILGPMAKRVKTDLRLPKILADRMKDLADQIGIPANAVYAAAAASFVVQFAKLTSLSGSLPSARRSEALVSEMERMFQNILAEVRKTL